MAQNDRLPSYKVGASSYPEVLDAQRDASAAQLHKALGGEKWARRLSATIQARTQAQAGLRFMPETADLPSVSIGLVFAPIAAEVGGRCRHVSKLAPTSRRSWARPRTP